MKKLDIKTKNYLLKKSTRKMRRLRMAKKKKKTPPKTSKETGIGYNYSVLAPSIIDLRNATLETLQYFEKVFSAINTCKKNQKIHFDMANVEVVGPETIMYLIAIMCNTKRLKILGISCGGNLPLKDEARSYFDEVGFYAFVNRLKFSPGKRLSDSNIQIQSGNSVDSALAVKICDFVSGRVSKEAINMTKRLYSMIIELMANTTQHTYNSSVSYMERNWYLYAEKNNDLSQLVFLDTGAGIPATVYYKISEKIKDSFTERNDAYYISSALRGEFRTETHLEHRGKGLPDILEDAIKGNFRNVTIISGKGKCFINIEGKIEEYSLPYEFKGTLFQWEF